MLSQVLTRKEQLVLMFLGGSIVFGGVVLYIVSQRTAADSGELPPPVVDAANVPPPPANEAPEPAATVQEQQPERIYVSVAGAVLSEGVYEFSDEGRVQDAIDAAGGLQAWADVRDINRAAFLIDGSTLTIPGEPENDRLVIRRKEPPIPNPPQYTVSGRKPPQGGTAVASGGAHAESGGTANGLIDLNRASLAQLETLPGIGPKLGAEIIRFRETEPFQTVDDLDLVSGIGPKKLEAVRGMVTVSQ